MTRVTETVRQVLWLGTSRQTPVDEELGTATPSGALGPLLESLPDTVPAQIPLQHTLNPHPPHGTGSTGRAWEYCGHRILVAP